MFRHPRPLPSLVLIAIVLVPLAVVVAVSFPRDVSGESFRRSFDEGRPDSAMAWQLYRETPSEYCFKRLRPLTLSSRYCVAKSELRVLDRSPLPHYVRHGQFELRENRRPGAKRLPF
jgi:hypothetical protein